MGSHPAPRAMPAWVAPLVAAYLANGGKVTTGKPCLARYRPAPAAPACYAYNRGA